MCIRDRINGWTNGTGGLLRCRVSAGRPAAASAARPGNGATLCSGRRHGPGLTSRHEGGAPMSTRGDRVADVTTGSGSDPSPDLPAPLALDAETAAALLSLIHISEPTRPY